MLGEFFRGLSGGEGVPGEFCRACRPRHHTLWCLRPLHIRVSGDLAALGAGCWRVGGVSEPHVVQFPRVVSGVARVLAEVLAAGPIDWQC